MEQENNLKVVEDTLNEVEYFYRRMEETLKIPQEFRHNLNAFISRARSVTWVLKKQYSTNRKFQKWYPQKEKEMKNDELMEFFINARNVSLKEHPLRTQTSTHIRHIEVNTPRGKGFAITGEGEPVWIDRDKTGKERKVHASEFDNEISIQYYFEEPKPPMPFQNLQVIDLCWLYLSSLKELVKEFSRILNEA